VVASTSTSTKYWATSPAIAPGRSVRVGVNTSTWPAWGCPILFAGDVAMRCELLVVAFVCMAFLSVEQELLKMLASRFEAGPTWIECLVEVQRTRNVKFSDERLRSSASAWCDLPLGRPVKVRLDQENKPSKRRIACAPGRHDAVVIFSAPLRVQFNFLHVEILSMVRFVLGFSGHSRDKNGAGGAPVARRAPPARKR